MRFGTCNECNKYKYLPNKSHCDTCYCIRIENKTGDSYIDDTIEEIASQKEYINSGNPTNTISVYHMELIEGAKIYANKNTYFSDSDKQSLLIVINRILEELK